MKWIKIGLASFFAGIIFIGLIYFLMGYFRPKPGGILVISTPNSDVFINGNLVGKTPYEGSFEPGEVFVKLVAETPDETYPAYETKVRLTSGFKTIVRREFGETEETSSGDIVSFDKGGKDGGLIVVSGPDNAQVSLDGIPRGFTPFKSATILAGEHQVAIKAVGFSDRVLTVKTVSDFELTIFAKLAKLPEEPKVEALTIETKVYVEILETPTGFLRVRTEPGSAGREIHQVRPGERFLLLEEDVETGWYKIELEAPAAGLPEGRVGWVSDEYSVLVQIPVTETPE